MNFLLIEKTISENKSVCFQISWLNPWLGKLLHLDMHVLTEEHIFRFGIQFLCFFSFTIDWSRRSDHAGFEIETEIFGFMILFHIYDCRHWDDENDRWHQRGSSVSSIEAS